MSGALPGRDVGNKIMERFVARSEAEAARSGVEHFFAQLNMVDVEVPGIPLAMQLPLGPHLTNMRGGLQGGLLATLVDVVAGRMALAGVGPNEAVATSNLNIHYLGSVNVGPAQAEGRVIRQGSRSAVMQVDVYDMGVVKDGSPLHAASATLTFAVMRPRSSSAEA